MATFLKLLSLNLLCKPYFGLILNLWSQIPPTLPPPGGPGAPWGRGLYFGGKWVVATFLSLHTKFELNSFKNVATTHLPPKNSPLPQGAPGGRKSWGDLTLKI